MKDHPRMWIFQTFHAVHNPPAEKRPSLRSGTLCRSRRISFGSWSNWRLRIWGFPETFPLLTLGLSLPWQFLPWQFVSWIQNVTLMMFLFGNLFLSGQCVFASEIHVRARELYQQNFQHEPHGAELSFSSLSHATKKPHGSHGDSLLHVPFEMSQLSKVTFERWHSMCQSTISWWLVFHVNHSQLWVHSKVFKMNEAMMWVEGLREAQYWQSFTRCCC